MPNPLLGMMLPAPKPIPVGIVRFTALCPHGTDSEWVNREVGRMGPPIDPCCECEKP
jgi:hypothetical protein